MPGIRRKTRIFLFAVVFTAACAGKSEAPAESWPDRMEVKVQEVAADEGEAPGLQVVLAPKKGWSINTAYPGSKVQLDEKVPAKARLLKLADGKFEDEKPGDKAARLVFSTTVEGEGALPEKVEGTYKAVICTKVTCSPPFTGSFAEAPEKVAAAPAKKAD